jgi:hypothetical protein
MPKPKKQTLADRAVAMLAEGRQVSEIAAELGCSDKYVMVCRKRAQIVAAGKVRTRNGIVDAAEVDGLYDRIGEKVRKTMARKKRLKQVGRMLAEARAQRMAEHEARRSSSITNRRAHVNRILEAWKGNHEPA